MYLFSFMMLTLHGFIYYLVDKIKLKLPQEHKLQLFARIDFRRPSSVVAVVTLTCSI